MDGALIPILLIVGVAVVAITLGVLYALGERKRREELRLIARQLGFTYRPDRDRSPAERYRFLNRIDKGTNRYAFNILRGELDGDPVELFDYHYETYSNDSKGNRTTHHHYQSFFVLTLPRSFPELTIGAEGFLSKIAQAFGYDDIDFESHEFSRAFCVRSKSKKFAYDVCHARMIEYLLANRDLTVEIDQRALSLVFGSRLRVEELRRNLERLRSLRALLPEYLFQ